MTSKPIKNSARILVINGGSSSIKFALFGPGAPVKRILTGQIKGIGKSSTLIIKGANPADNFSQSVKAPNHAAAGNLIIDWLQKRIKDEPLAAIGHRIVHGGAKFWAPQLITSKMVAALRGLSAFDPEHLPEEILLIQTFQKRFPKLPQVACFDTAFHHNLPTVSRRLPLPRKYDAEGIRRYGFHGLSYTYLMEEIARIAGKKATRGNIILAHLGGGASITAVQSGHSIDTSMGFTPAAGLPMSTRTGDLDPGLPFYFARAKKMTPKQFNHMVNHEAGLLGISGLSGDMKELQSSQNPHAKEAVEIFCYQAKKFIGAYAAALGGLDRLVFAGGIGENDALVRGHICAGLKFLGLELDPKKNRAHAAVISRNSSKVLVQIIPTDEEIIIAKSVHRILLHR